VSSLEIRGICSLCGRPGKMYTCTLCGSIVCGSCYNLQRSVCKSCEQFKTGDTCKSIKWTFFRNHQTYI